MDSSCENGIHHSGSVKGREYVDWCSNHKLLKKKSLPWCLLVVI